MTIACWELKIRVMGQRSAWMITRSAWPWSLIEGSLFSICWSYDGACNQCRPTDDWQSHDNNRPCVTEVVLWWCCLLGAEDTFRHYVVTGQATAGERRGGCDLRCRLVDCLGHYLWPFLAAQLLSVYLISCLALGVSLHCTVGSARLPEQY